MQKPEKPIPIMHPLLPEYKYVERYLKEIDQNRWYSNFGPLVQQFEEQLAQFFGLEDECVKTVCSGTAGLVNTLRALDPHPGSLCIMPSWTFIATPAAAISVNMEPYFVDVDAQNWAIEPESLKEQIKDIPQNKIGAVIVVSPFGSPIDTAAWDNFTEETGIPVVIDAAAAFDTASTMPQMQPSKTPMVISMHATKIFGIGEGGCVLSTDKDLLWKIQQMSNFGFTPDRTINIPGTNGKMSEYAAAIGLAGLDLWPQTREVWIRLKSHYINAFKHIPEQISSPWLAEEWANSTCNIRLPGGHIEEIIEQLRTCNIMSRQWWDKGCHVQPAYAIYPHAPLPVTEQLGNTVISLPFTINLQQEEIDYVVSSLAEILEEVSVS